MVDLIACDMDGTLLRSGSYEVSEEGIELINKLTDMGIKFAVASGRQYASLKRLLENVNSDIIYICENGGLIKYKEETLFKSSFNREEGILLMEDILNRGDCEFILSGEETAYIMPKSTEYEEHLIKNIKNNVKRITSFDEVEEDFIKISVYEKSGILNHSDYFMERWGDKIKSTVSGKAWMDFVPLDVNKGRAVKFMQNYLDIGQIDSMCFGDNFNDLEMFDACEYSYAMTAADINVRKRAKYVTNTVESILYDVYMVLNR